MNRIVCSIVLVMVLAGLSACSRGGDPSCEGSKGCVCNEQKPCATGLVCQAGSCQEEEASVGQEVLPKDGGHTPADGGSLVDKPACDAGALACRCRASEQCDAGLRCDNGICQQCPEGTAGCACKKDNQCESGLQCESGMCRGCMGKAFCPCHGNNSCDTGNLCEISSDGSATCKPCEDRANKAGCNCDADKDCGGSVICINKRCLDPAEMRKVPNHPRCYTPCEGDRKENDGTIRTCHARYKLMTGCQIGQVCQDGSCLAAKFSDTEPSLNDYPFCKKDADCPSWQACIAGRCYSNCQSNSDCSDGFVCHSYVCRRRCTLQKNTCDDSKDKTRCQVCGSEQVCQRVSATEEEGVCMPLSIRKLAQQPETKKHAVLGLNVRQLSFTNQTTSDQFVVFNQGDFEVEVEIHRESDTLKRGNPLSWIKFDQCKTYDTSDENKVRCSTFEGKPTSQNPLKLKIPGNSRVTLKVSNVENAPNSPGVYDGILQIKSADSQQILGLTYRRSGSGRWRGKMYSMGNFADDNIKDIRSSSAQVQQFPNALVRRWIQFRRNELDIDKLKALLRSMQEGTWKLPKVQSDCQKLFSQVGTTDLVCYPYASDKGYELFSISSKEAPVPTGVSALDFVIDLEEKSSTSWEGRVVSAATLQYAGDPKITITFEQAAGSQTNTFVKSLLVQSDLGGRYTVAKTAACRNSSLFEKQTMPWLLLDFVGMSETVAGQIVRERPECRQHNLPWLAPSGASDKVRAEIKAKNQSLSGANPLPNGRVLRRSIEMIDGVLYNNDTLIVLVRETFTSPFSGRVAANSPLATDWVRYGYLWLERSNNANSQDVSPKGNAPVVCQQSTDCAGGSTCQQGVCQSATPQHQVSCTAELVFKASKRTISKTSDLESWSTSQLDDLAYVLAFGQTKDNLSQLQGVKGQVNAINKLTYYSYTNPATQKTHSIHYLCRDTGQFNGGPAGNPMDCPKGSEVLFFELADIDELDLRKDACNRSRDCGQRYEQLKSATGFRENIPYRCGSANTAVCDGSGSPKDLRADKVFFPETGQGNGYVSPFSPLQDSVRRAFRYRFKFQTRAGASLGFAPSLCSETSPSSTPYCYDAKAIEAVEERVNCIQYLVSNDTIRNKLSSGGRGQLRSQLVWAFGYNNTQSSGGAILTDFGFETLNAELRVMLGDESYVQALSSRYDLAQTNLVAFEGSKMEPNGIDLSGVLGYEMYLLYRSAHYYQSVLDRFYSQIDVMAASFKASDTAFLSAKSVTSYVPKLLLAATRKARSWSQIARKYHGMQRMDLARHVMERAYISTYIEQIILTRLLNALAQSLAKEQIPQLRAEIERTSLTYNAALVDMQETYEKVSKEVDTFGLEPGYIPFPAIDSLSVLRNSQNAFTLSLAYAKQKLETAKQKEDIALQSQRSFDTNAAQFQSELVKIDTNYNEQLIQLCGALQGDDGRQVPAIPRYAALLPEALRSANPCGRVAGSQIYDGYQLLERAALQAMQLDKQRKDLFARIDAEKQRIQQTCANTFKLSDITWSYLDQRKDLEFARSDSEIIIQRAIRAGTQLISLAMGWKCEEFYGGAIQNLSKGTCGRKGLSNSLKIAAFVAQETATTILQLQMRDVQREMMSMQRDFAQSQIRLACDLCGPDEQGCGKPGYARVASQLYMTQLVMQLQSLRLQALQVEYNLRIVASQIEGMKQRAQRLMQEQADALAMLASVQAAANDPNQRIYKNDAVITAERTFQEALQEAYRATLIYEYYTSQSYQRKSDLFLIRMVARSDLNLEGYLSRLERAYLDFEESAGKSALRVAVISLRDDMIKIPRLDKDNKPISNTERARLFQAALNNPNNYNKDGYLRFSFCIDVGPQGQFVSPITYNHKVAFVEAEIQGTEVGNDGVGRIYLQQRGTGVVRNSDNSSQFYSLPQRTAVINPYFNGTKSFATDIYRNFRLQDRPLGNSQWEFLFNQVTEKANQDINLNSISDVILYIYYKDFTKN